MLKHLYISQYALIDELELALEDGFSVITGETGAGKSIIMGALALVMGARADSKIVRDGAHKCVVEAQFLIKDSQFSILNLKIWIGKRNVLFVVKLHRQVSRVRL